MGSATDGVDTAAAELKAAELAKARAAGWTETVAFNYDEFQRQGDYEWLGNAKVYEWSEEYGDVAPGHPELERQLYGGEDRVTAGDHRKVLDEIEVAIEGPTKVAPIQNFEDGGLHPVVLENIQRCGYGKPTPIQAYTIPAVKLGYDVVGIAQTGSGKTASYLIPIISGLMGKAKKLRAPRPNVTDPRYDPKQHRVRAEPLVLILVPTRELAVQVFDEARRLCYRSMLRPCVAYGGFPMGQQIDDLGKGCDILIGSCGRLMDLMDKPDVLSMNRVKYTVIDEADELLNEDWSEEMLKILGGGDANDDADHIFMMFSATFPKGARRVAREYMADDHFRIRVGRAGQAHKNITQAIIEVDGINKREAVYDLLFAQDPARTLIFCNSKPGVDQLDDFLYNKGLPTTSIHSDRNPREREDALRSFKTGRTPILIATGVSARGWDVSNVAHVINYDMPSAMYGGIQEYIHRIGRTARIGNRGLATSFYNERNEDIAQDLVNVLVECEQEVPDFLSHLKPEPTEIQFDDNSDDEADGEGFGGEDGGAAWGAESGDAAPAEPADNGFQADAGFSANHSSKPAAAADGW
ncbi:Putative ATP-dependent RNA helicase DEAD-box, Helicase superfamily 1/2, ATP-binding protein [Septoria linicola]|uniref:RNA helicase n=1 Tax=Septoria linicola TaxID=215465 RepID=A0A9Q9ARU2_9PEZI|nr:putative ATP-dependent RNA helicase DEAD-box, Helicase superfamily 1/2, ATP-binding protein [Septoria linicola]USW50892.1 Putative ATP-dependent RNA helicase DEAD-box, Helicase superfamily 1/2, ATP-binding protein [Septoria linicola]